MTLSLPRYCHIEEGSRTRKLGVRFHPQEARRTFDRAGRLRAKRPKGPFTSWRGFLLIGSWDRYPELGQPQIPSRKGVQNRPSETMMGCGG